MKKNWKETLKLWLGAILLFFATMAEAVSTGCKKLRTLPKKVMAVCVAAALVVAMVPVAVGAAETTNYDIWVEGTQVTSENQSNVLGKTGWSGATVTYDPMFSHKRAWLAPQPFRRPCHPERGEGSFP